MFAVSGLSSGLNTKEIVDQLMSIDGRPKLKMEWNQQLATSRQGIWNELKTRLGAMQTAANELLKFETFQLGAGTPGGTWNAASGDPSRLSATIGSAPAAGTYNIVVQQLAQGEVSRSSGAFAGVAAPDTMTITQGGSSWNVALAAGDQLGDIANSINSVPGIGVFASIDAGALKLTSTTTGSTSAFSVSSTGTTAADLGLQETQTAHNLQYTVDGTPHSSTKNSGVTGAIADVALSFNGTTSTTLTVSQGTPGTTPEKAREDAIVEKMKAFVTAYNAVLDYVYTKTQGESKVTSPANKSAGMSLSEFLTGPMARNVQMSQVATDLRTAMSSVVAGMPSGSNLLGDIGIKSGFEISVKGAKGKLTIDETKLRAAIQADPTKVQDLIGKAGASTAGADDGLLRRVSELSSQMTSITGSVGGAAQNQDANIKRLQTSIDRAQTNLDRRRTYYEKMYASMETMLGKLNSQGSWLSSQLQSMQNSRG